MSFLRFRKARVACRRSRRISSKKEGESERERETESGERPYPSFHVSEHRASSRPQASRSEVLDTQDARIQRYGYIGSMQACAEGTMKNQINKNMAASTANNCRRLWHSLPHSALFVHQVASISVQGGMRVDANIKHAARGHGAFRESEGLMYPPSMMLFVP